MKRFVEQKFAKGKSQSWKNRDYEDLSFVIHQETKILISVATLKRFFGKVKTADDYSPQKSTVDALSGYANYQEDKKPTVFSYKLGILVLLCFFAIASITWLLRSKNISEKSELIDKCRLELIKQEGRCPGTAFFEFSIPNTTENVFLNFGDGSKRYPVRKERKHAHFYEYPGNFNAYLQSGKSVVSDTIGIFIPTNDWQAFSHYFKSELRDRYYPVPLNKNSENGVFHASPKSLASLGLDTSKIVVVRIDNYMKTNKNGDSFTYQNRFKNSSFWPAIRCYSSIILIEGTKGRIQFKFVAKGCSRHSKCEMGEIIRSGEEFDLSAFVVDHNDWVDVEIVNVNKNVHVKLNGEVVFSELYQSSIGDIIGTSLIFHGSGSLDYIQLKSENNDCIFENDF